MGTCGAVKPAAVIVPPHDLVDIALLALACSLPVVLVGGLIIGVGENLSEVYIGPMVGGGIEIWFAYMLALVFLLFRPQGLFGEKIIERV